MFRARFAFVYLLLLAWACVLAYGVYLDAGKPTVVQPTRLVRPCLETLKAYDRCVLRAAEPTGVPRYATVTCVSVGRSICDIQALSSSESLCAAVVVHPVDGFPVIEGGFQRSDCW